MCRLHFNQATKRVTHRIKSSRILGDLNSAYFQIPVSINFSSYPYVAIATVGVYLGGGPRKTYSNGIVLLEYLNEESLV